VEAIELVVVGAGPCGIGVGASAQKVDVGCVLFDKSSITSSIARYPTYMTFFSTAERLEIGGVPFIPMSDKPTRREALKYYRRVVDEYALDVRQFEEVLEITRDGDLFVLRTRTNTGMEAIYAARNLAIATGYFDYPNKLNVPGEDLPFVLHEYREGHPFYKQRSLIVGGGNSAVEAALELHRAGAIVSLIHFENQLDARVKPWILPDMAGRIRENEITVYWRSRITEIHPGSVSIVNIDTAQESDIPVDWVLAMTGYTPSPWMLRSLGVSIDDATGIPAHNPDTMETDVPGVFVVGVISAGYQANHIFIENGREHGPKIVQRVLERRTR
jgi:thioredoxin reductase (NADPH)